MSLKVGDDTYTIIFPTSALLQPAVPSLGNKCSHQPEKMSPKDQVESWLQQTQDTWEEIAMIFYSLSDVLNEQLALIVLLVIVGIPRRFSIRNPSYLCRLRTPSLLQCLFPVIFPSEVCLIMN